MIRMDEQQYARTAFLATRSDKVLFALSAAAAVFYFFLLLLYFPIGNRTLFMLLVIGQSFHLWQLLTFIHTVWDTEHEPVAGYVDLSVDVFITVTGEPRSIIEETVRAALAMEYPHTRVYILNDGYVAGKDNWRESVEVARELGAECITRTKKGGAKAGNINNALRQTNAPLIAIFDADHVPHPDFLRKCVRYFADPAMAFVQTPQFYKNAQDSYVSKSAWEQQELFFGPICKGKNRLNAATMCGTNMLVRRAALEEVGGMAEESIAEDFVTGLFLHERSWKSYYLPEVLAEGLAPHDLGSYYKQQFRWARGALDIIFRYNPLFRRGLSWTQKMQYLASASFYFTGLIVAVYASLPLLFFYFGLVPLEIAGMLLASVLLPYLFLTLYTIQLSSNFSYTFNALAFSMAAFNVHIAAIFAAALRRTSAFLVTPKEREGGSAFGYVVPQMLYVALAAAGLIIALEREGLSASVVNNAAWAVMYVVIFATFIRAALPQSSARRLPSLNLSPQIKRVADQARR
ncbi:hypothetical protein COU20_02835 [Candidatus Kaiserbacteria bacterium CG10_big_fil_rev_8_21_14_0_10_59_10]|uniref:Glycosyltransferase 2-like domain-containing protein n=1 Tax=Candidatus Kaiserbacteria bacterium CG10_big_fil_rev_8_21_14_0_10_59_10 TaxID=1974612 RepID=A0A2H0U992_9BACT|nr:MAG: hypothetical protein COU20_02835 [Candidatus Kaiserbacteria bacterium CG10_big_fil_rev_8_21_14_0_10_59_10]